MVCLQYLKHSRRYCITHTAVLHCTFDQALFFFNKFTSLQHVNEVGMSLVKQAVDAATSRKVIRLVFSAIACCLFYSLCVVTTIHKFKIFWVMFFCTIFKMLRVFFFTITPSLELSMHCSDVKIKKNHFRWIS